MFQNITNTTHTIDENKENAKQETTRYTQDAQGRYIDPQTGAPVDVNATQQNTTTTRTEVKNFGPPRSDNTEEAKRLAHEAELAKKQSKQFSESQQQYRDTADALDSELKKAEAAADAHAMKLAKLQLEHRKGEEKGADKLGAIEEKAMKIAAELTEKQQRELAEERQREAQLQEAEAEAHRLALLKLEAIERQRLSAEARANELAKQQADAKQKFAQLSKVQQEDDKIYKIQVTELRESELAARRQADELQKRLTDGRARMAEREKELKELEGKFKLTRDLLATQQKEIQELANRQQQLANEEAANKEKVNQLTRRMDEERRVIIQKRQELMSTEAEAKDIDYLLRRQEEERKTLETEFRQAGRSEEEAKRRAKELADRHADELKSAQAEIQELTERERHIRERLSRLAQNANRQAELSNSGEAKTAIVHTIQEVKIPAGAPHLETEPHVTAGGVEVTEEVAKGPLEKIGDAISSIF